MKNSITVLIAILFFINSFAQQTEKKVSKDSVTAAKAAGKEITYSRPFNVFIAAGIGYRIRANYNVTISPVDRTVQFQAIPPLFSSIATGLLWNPFSDTYKVTTYDGKKKDWHYEYRRKGFTTALLINIFNLSFGANTNALPLDVGFGLGYKKEDFLVLGTIEFKPLRQPRKYFVEEYQYQNKQLFLSGSTQPERNVDQDDDTLFFTVLYPSIGIKVAYSFGSQTPK